MTDNSLVPVQPHALVLVGQFANEAAAANLFAAYRQRIAAETLQRQDNDLALFARYLAQAGITGGNLALDAQAWHGSCACSTPIFPDSPAACYALYYTPRQHAPLHPTKTGQNG